MEEVAANEAGASGVSAPLPTVESVVEEHHLAIQSLTSRLDRLTSILEATLRVNNVQAPPDQVPIPENQSSQNTSESSAPQEPQTSGAQIPLTSSAAIVLDFSSELARKTNPFQDGYKLKGPENFELWKQALGILLRVIGFQDFLINPSLADSLPDSQQAALLLKLRESLTEGPQAAISWIDSPSQAYNLLKSQYSYSIDLQRDALNREFHSLVYSASSQDTIASFNARFNGCVSKLQLAGVVIQSTDLINQYLYALEKEFPAWTERIRGTFRTLRATGQPVQGLNLQFLMADIMEETRNPTSSAYSASTPNSEVQQAKPRKTPAKGPKKQGKRPTEGRSGGSKRKNYHKGKGKEGDEPPFTCPTHYIPGQVSYKTGSFSLSEGTFSDLSPEDSNTSGSEYSKKKASFLLQRPSKDKGFQRTKTDPKWESNPSKNKGFRGTKKEPTSQGSNSLKDALLYDTGSTVHIVNRSKYFKSLDYNAPLGTVLTGGGPIRPKGVGTAVFQIEYAPGKYRGVALQNALYIPSMDLNIFSGLRHYRSGGYVAKNKLFWSSGAPLATLEIEKSGFFLPIKGVKVPTAHFSGYSSNSLRYISPGELVNPLEIQLPPFSKEKAREYEEFPHDSDESDPSRSELAPSKPKFTPNRSGIEPDSLGERPCVPKEIKSGPEAKPCESKLVGAKPSTTGRSGGNRPSVPEPPVGNRGGTTIEDLEDLPLEGLSPSKQLDPEGGKTSKLLKLALLWHQRLGHPSLSLLKKTARITQGMPNFDSIKESDFLCLACSRAKAIRRLNFKPIADPPRALDSIEADTFTVKPNPYNRKPIGLLIVDRKSRYRWLFLLKNRDGAGVLGVLQGFIKSLKNKYGRYPKRFHFDGGKEITLPFQAWLQRKGIEFSTSSPYIHEQNGLVERSIRVLLDRLRATLLAANLPLYLWNFVVFAVLELVNCTAATNRDKTSHQDLFDDLEPSKTHKPLLKRYRVIGAVCEVLIPEEKRSKAYKLAPRTETGRLLAVVGSNTYLVYIAKRHAVVKTSILKIFESKQPNLLESPPVASNQELEGEIPPNPSEIGDPGQLGTSVEDPLNLPKVGTGKDPNQNSSPLAEEPVEAPGLSVAPEGENPRDFPGDLDLDPPKDLSIDSSQDGSQPPDGPIESLDPDMMDLDFLALRLVTAFKARQTPNSSVPQTWKQVLKSPDRDRWLEAIFKEFEQVLRQETLSFLSRKKLPKGRTPISSRLVLRPKKDENNRLVKFKARLVVRGFQQRHGIDYNETFASTSTPSTWRVLLALAAIHDWEIEQIDFIGAFLNGVLKESIYMEIPEGFKAFAEQAGPEIQRVLEISGYDSAIDQVIRLRKALYGLKQSPREWQQVAIELLKSLGFKPLLSDSAVYHSGSLGIFIVTYVDDWLIIGPDIAKIQGLKRKIHEVYAIEDRGPAGLFLGVQISRDRRKRTLWLSQRHYIEEALETFNLKDSRVVNVPLQPALVSSKAPEGPLLDTKTTKLFQALVGTAIFIAVFTRIDICYTVQWLARHFQAPRSQHLKAAIGLFRYLKGHKDLTIKYSAKGSSLPVGYSDSNFADDSTSKSTYGYVFTLGGGPISWKSKRGSTIALSTLEAEFIGLIEATRELLWLRGLYEELKRPISGPLTLYGDNTGAISTAKDPTHHNRTKHTLLKYNYLREEVRKGTVLVTYISTGEMLADGLTKALPPPKFQGFLSLLGLERVPSSGP